MRDFFLNSVDSVEVDSVEVDSVDSVEVDSVGNLVQIPSSTELKMRSETVSGGYLSLSKA